MKKFLNKATLPILFIVLLSLPAILALFQPGFFVTDDGEWMIIRFSAFHQALRDGEFPVRFLGRLNHEYGYPVATFLYPGFMYLAEPLHLVGFGFVDSIKLLLGFSLISSGVSSYFWLRRHFDSTASVVGALFYIYTPYHLYDLYKRGSVGEMLALAVLPFILWQIERKSLFWSSLSIGLLVLSHNTLAVLFIIFIFCYMMLDVVISKKKSIGLQYLLMLVLGSGLSAFFWIPALFELSNTVFSDTVISNWKEYFAPVSLLGYSTIVVLFVAVVLVGLKTIQVKKQRLMLLVGIFCFGSLFLSIQASNALWNILPVGFIQFPFRFLSITLLCVSFLAAASVGALKGNQKLFLSAGLLLVLFLSALPFLKPTENFNKGEAYYMTNTATSTVMDEYMPVWVKEKPLQKWEQKVAIIKGEGNIENIIYTDKRASFVTVSSDAITVQVNTIYWPGWNASVDGKSVPIVYDNKGGLIEIAIPKGTHTVQVVFGETGMRLVSDAISVSSLFVLLLLNFFKKKLNF